MNELTNDNEILEVSKSQRKREAHALLQLARQLADMPANLLSSLPLDAELSTEIEFARNIRARGARKRQVMTVAKMLRQRDNQELLDAIEQIDQNNRRESASNARSLAHRATRRFTSTTRPKRRNCLPKDRKSTRLNSSHSSVSRMPSSA